MISPVVLWLLLQLDVVISSPPSFVQGVAEAIAERSVPKLFLLNGSIDRETSRRAAGSGPMHASDMVQVISSPVQAWGTRTDQPMGKH